MGANTFSGLAPPAGARRLPRLLAHGHGRQPIRSWRRPRLAQPASEQNRRVSARRRAHCLSDPVSLALGISHKHALPTRPTNVRICRLSCEYLGHVTGEDRGSRRSG
jgi:hypothetical protein